MELWSKLSLTQCYEMQWSPMRGQLTLYKQLPLILFTSLDINHTDSINMFTAQRQVKLYIFLHFFILSLPFCTISQAYSTEKEIKHNYLLLALKWLNRNSHTLKNEA